ncbi:RNA polymerase sigma-54 factor [Clostridium omnivorum]|uniref:RNA polymerase sigma-54 factor n=2 Tax=Clostridium omnivorum TaxID=1604902 RepID=A0ABQ5N1H0_9CLOT|nr:RNA polymerase sigma-54 factor [Clostridium sp. E14]
MQMNFNLNLTQEQKLIMTQQMQLSVKLLQMSTFDLQQHIEKEAQENPVLDITYNDTDKESLEKRLDYKEMVKYFEFDNYGHHFYEKSDEDEVSPFNFVSEKKSLKDFLKEQLIDLGVKDYSKFICEYIIDSINGKGYLDSSTEEIGEELGLPSEIIEKAISFVQTLEPDGIAARNLRECLKIQLKKKRYDDEKLYILVDNFLEALAENKYALIAKELNVDIKRAQEYGDIIKTLEPKPSRGFYTGDEVKYITPDAYIKNINGEYFILINDSILPKIIINDTYREIIANEKDKLALDYVKEKINSALFLVKSIEQRKSTIYRVLEKILELQKEYFDKGEKYLKPMTLKDIAESLDMHESTVSRAIKEKYISTNRGTIKIKDLFTTGLSTNNSEEDVSTTFIKNKIKDLIDKEDKNKPLSDQTICDKLNEDGMNISRRTVAKYREEMNIKSSSKRKRF